MIYGIGCDLVCVARIQSAFDDHPQRFLKRILTPEEHKHYHTRTDQIRFLAKRFALKEAVVKSLRIGFQGCSWQDLNIENDAQGAPGVQCSKKLQVWLKQHDIAHIHVSVSDEKDHVMAMAVAVRW